MLIYLTSLNEIKKNGIHKRNNWQKVDVEEFFKKRNATYTGAETQEQIDKLAIVDMDEAGYGIIALETLPQGTVIAYYDGEDVTSTYSANRTSLAAMIEENKYVYEKTDATHITALGALLQHLPLQEEVQQTMRSRIKLVQAAEIALKVEPVSTKMIQTANVEFKPVKNSLRYEIVTSETIAAGKLVGGYYGENYWLLHSIKPVWYDINYEKIDYQPPLFFALQFADSFSKNPIIFQKFKADMLDAYNNSKESAVSVTVDNAALLICSSRMLKYALTNDLPFIDTKEISDFGNIPFIFIRYYPNIVQHELGDDNKRNSHLLTLIKKTHVYILSTNKKLDTIAITSGTASNDYANTLVFLLELSKAQWHSLLMIEYTRPIHSLTGQDLQDFIEFTTTSYQHLIKVVVAIHELKSKDIAKLPLLNGLLKDSFSLSNARELYMLINSETRQAIEGQYAEQINKCFPAPSHNNNANKLTAQHR